MANIRGRNPLDTLPFNDDDMPTIRNFNKHSTVKKYGPGRTMVPVEDNKFWTGKKFAAFIALILIMSVIGAQFGAGLYALLTS